MPIVTKELYAEYGFNSNIKDFEKLSRLSEIIVEDTCVVKPDDVIKNTKEYKEAVCNEIEFLNEQGGADAVLGFSEYSQGLKSESLGSYSISAPASADSLSKAGGVETVNGIPISSISIMLLRKLGLMTRCAFVKASDLYAE